MRYYSFGTEVRVTNSMLYTGRVGVLRPTSGDPDDWWDYYVELNDRVICVYHDQVELVNC